LLVALLGALAVVTPVAAQRTGSLTPAQLRILDDIAKGSLGQDEPLRAKALDLLGLKEGTGRQLGVSSDNNATHHFFNRFAADGGAIVLGYRDSAHKVYEYRVDDQLRFVCGYIAGDGDSRALTETEGQAGVDSELAWWNSATTDLIEEIKTALALGKSADEVANEYGVSADTLKRWLADAAPS
jgi:hypothetical protein